MQGNVNLRTSRNHTEGDFHILTMPDKTQPSRSAWRNVYLCDLGTLHVRCLGRPATPEALVVYYAVPTGLLCTVLEC